MVDFENLQRYREDNRIEAKEALGGLPESIWETYSAFANAEGGVILLGVEELPDKSLHALDILDPQWLIEDFWRIINDRSQVSANILAREDVQIHHVDGKQIIAITVPKADARHRPVYIGGDPYRGSYHRRGESDYRIEKEEINAMLAQRKNMPDKLPENLVRSIAGYIEKHYEEICQRAMLAAETPPQADGSMPVADCERIERVRPAMAAMKSMSLEDMLRQADAGFTETLLKLIDRTGKKDSEIYKKANISKQHFSKIRNNLAYKPTKPTAIALALALELDLEETRDLIGRAGYALTNSSKFDLIIRYFIENRNYNVVEINVALYEFDQPLLGG